MVSGRRAPHGLLRAGACLLLLLDGSGALRTGMEPRAQEDERRAQEDQPIPIPVRGLSPRRPETILAFSSHHKTGTCLLNHLCDHFKRASTGDAQAKCARCGILKNITSNGSKCLFIVVSNDLGKKTYSPKFYDASEKMLVGPTIPSVQKYAKNYRIAHIIRDPLMVLASAFIYDQKGVDHSGVGKAELQGLSLEDGLRKKSSDTVMKKLMDEILDGHLRAQKDSNIMEFRYEDFETNFNATVRQLFSFLHGRTDHQRQLSMVDFAQVDNKRRWSAGKLEQPHVSSEEEKRSVLGGIAKLCRQNDPSVMKMLAYREPLGYDPRCPGPSGGVPSSGGSFAKH